MYIYLNIYACIYILINSYLHKPITVRKYIKADHSSLYICIYIHTHKYLYMEVLPI